MSSTHVLAPRSRLRRPITVLAVVAAVALAGLMITRVAGSGEQPVRVTARFADASPLVPGNAVQLDGVQVGTIEALNLVADGVDVVVALDRSALPLQSDATMRIEPVSLLGERFLELDKGSPSAPRMAEPMVIARERTSAAVDVDDLVSVLDRSASTGLAALVGTLGEGIAHQGDRVAQAVADMPPNLRQFDRVSTLLDQQNAVLSSLVVSAEKNATALSGPLDSLVDATRQSLGVVAEHRRALDAGLTQLPGALTEARTTLNELGGAADNTKTVLSGVRPLTRDLRQTGRELRDFAETARPALESLPEVLDKANRMLDEARPVVAELGPAAGHLRSASGSARSLKDDLIAHPSGVASGLENLMTFMADWAMSSNAFDGVAHYFKFKLVAMPSAVLTTVGGALPQIADARNDPFNPERRNPNGPNHSDTTPVLPMLPALPNPDGPDNSSYTTPGDQPRTAPDRGRSSAPGGVSRLTPKQESDMFSQLLGGG